MLKQAEPITVANTKPFLKWTGGKQKLVSTLVSQYLPAEIPGSIHSHFLGAGSFELALMTKFPNKPFYLYDAVIPLITTWKAVKFIPDRVSAALEELVSQYKNDPDFYYQVRDSFNQSKNEEAALSTNAARMIFINRACYNGLYRVNSKDTFNTPVGKHKSLTFPTSAHLTSVSKTIQNAQFSVLPYEDFTVAGISPGDFIYQDPPHFKTYAGYTADQSWGHDPGKLLDLACDWKFLTLKGVHLLQSNADTPEVRSAFKDFYLYPVTAKTSVGQKVSSRGNRAELAITNYLIPGLTPVEA